MTRRIFFFSSTRSAEHRNGEPNAGLGVRGVMPLLVDELVVEPELELPLPTVTGRSVAAIYVFCSVSVTIRQHRLGWLPRSEPVGVWEGMGWGVARGVTGRTST